VAGASNSYTDVAAIVPWVTEAQRATFDAEFRGKSLQELSVMSMSVIARKR
jgi:hypothetical protein